MQTIWSHSLLILFLATTSWAQESPLPETVPKDQCMISLPYLPEQKNADCSPKPAAAYDFAFCSVHYVVTSLSAPPSDKALGEKSMSEQYRRAGVLYARLSEVLSDANAVQ